jgi:hypothetical protein
MINVIAYSLFGKPSGLYANSVITVLYASRVLYPNWKIRLYHDENLGSDVKNICSELNVDLYFVKNDPKLCEGMLWRIKPLFDKDVKYLICRDVDSLPCPQDRFAVEEFVQNAGTFHNICASTSHSVPVMGGLCGFDAEEFRKKYSGSWDELIQTTLDLNKKGTDQYLLKDKVWPLLNSNSIEHRFAGEPWYPITKLFKSVNYMLQTECNLKKELYDEANRLAQFPGHAGFNISLALNFYESQYRQTNILNYWHENKPQYAVFSSNINSDFDFFLPLTSALWQRISFQPFIFLVGKESEWLEKRNVVIEHLINQGVSLQYVDEIPPVQTHSIAQIIRLFAYCHINDASEIITTDADIWPLANQGYWQNHDSTPIKNWTFSGLQETPICYVSMQSLTWRKVIGSRLPYGVSARDELFEQLKLGPGISPTIDWGYDQLLLSLRIKESELKTTSILRIPNHKLDHRVDRGCWEIDYPNDVDAHLLRPGWSIENWQRIISLFNMYLPEQREHFENYRNEYVKTVIK